MTIVKKSNELTLRKRPHLLMCYYGGNGFEDSMLLNSSEAKEATYPWIKKISSFCKSSEFCRLFLLNDTCRTSAQSYRNELA